MTDGLRQRKSRRSIRLPGHDYASPGAYFVTVCTHAKQPLFENALIATAVENAWRALPEHFSHIRTDGFVIMPNHIHGILWLTDERNVGARHASPLRRRHRTDDALLAAAHGFASRSLAAVVASFKSAATKRANELRSTPGAPLWQRNYYERVIRNEEELRRVREYIELNPSRWQFDRDNPCHETSAKHRQEWGWLEGAPE
jgi:REP element-mobilizing transposase RayT